MVGLAGCASSNNEQLIKNQLAMDSQQKLEFDRVFFNEIWLWNQNSWRYGIPSNAKRQKEFEVMAAQGYLPAYVALKMFDFEKQTKSPDTAAFKLLRQAADAGDVSSACALIPIWTWNDIDGYPREYHWAAPYVEQGMKEKHFACMTQMALLYQEGLISPPDTNEEKKLLLLSAQAGYTHAFVLLRTKLVGVNQIVVPNLNPAMCWNAAYSLYTPWLSLQWDYYKAAAEGAYPQFNLSTEQRQEIGRLAKKWRERTKSAKDVMDIVNECLILEGGFN